MNSMATSDGISLALIHQTFTPASLSARSSAAIAFGSFVRPTPSTYTSEQVSAQCLSAVGRYCCEDPMTSAEHLNAHRSSIAAAGAYSGSPQPVIIIRFAMALLRSRIAS